MLLTSSKYSRRQVYPMRLSFDVMKMPQNNDAYNKSYLPVAVMMEGEFDSYFKNRVSSEMENGLKELGLEFKEKSENATQVFISDKEIFKNYYDPGSGKISPLGFNRWDGTIYGGNGEFALNLIDYLTNEYGLLESRTKSIQLRLLDKVRLTEDRVFWQWMNVAFPVILILIFGYLYNYLRRRKYAKG